MNIEMPITTCEGYKERIKENYRLYTKLIKNESPDLTWPYSMQRCKSGTKTTMRLPIIHDANQTNSVNMNIDNSNHKTADNCNI